VDGAPVALTVVTRGGPPRALAYRVLEEVRPGAFRGVTDVRLGGGSWQVSDLWERDAGGVSLVREIRSLGAGEAAGVNLRVAIGLPGGSYRFFIPGACYDYCPVENDTGHAIVSEERCAWPLVMAWDERTGEARALMRTSPATTSLPRVRQKGETEFLHATDIGGLGYDRRASSAGLMACLPYAEQPSSRMLGRGLAPFSALLPTGGDMHVRVSYRLETFTADGFDAACFESYGRAHAFCGPVPLDPERDLRSCVHARMDCLAGLARDWNGHSGLALNFDPRVNRESPPSGYGTGFNTLESSVFPRILEYGFTGRQLNNAFMLASCGDEWGMPGWKDSARGITRSFLESCARPNGFLHTLYDVARGRAISPFDDETGSALHYGVRGAPAGNYARNMAEAGLDLCLLSRVFPDAGAGAAANRLGRFFLGTQNRDGSWFRAYTEGGTAITAPEQWFGGSARANKSATATVIPFMTELSELTGNGEYLTAARRAGAWLLDEVVSRADYRGGTLDNPNVVDKEGMGYPMMALLRLYELTGERDCLDGATRAGGLALTWNTLWDVPFEEGTRLRSLSFRSRGWGGISILWGCGVVDNYSLWFLPGWMRLAELTGRGVFRDTSRLILHGTQQLLSLRGNLCGLCDQGMQEEGFACSDQGVDEGMIRKGDTWGALGWVFAAGTYCVWKALQDDPAQ
jgi:hypothetical protein